MTTDDNDELSLLLATATEDINEIASETTTNPKIIPRLQEDESFAKAFMGTIDISSKNDSKINLKQDKDFDSSDDEDVRNFLEQKYNEYGREINKKLKEDLHEKKSVKIEREVIANIKENSSLSIQTKNRFSPSSSSQATKDTRLPTTSRSNMENSAVFTDPVFGLRIINPLISSSVLVERMNGRQPVSVPALQFHTERGDLTKDWVVAGAILSKSPIKTTKTGGLYSIWKLTDLKGAIKTFSLFLFKSAQKELWKTATGMCIAILNPSVFENRKESGDVACLSIDNPQKVMVLGQSKDMGTCKAKKKNGDKCTVTVNLSDCDYCLYHIKQEYSMMSKRPGIQSKAGGGGLEDLRNKVLGKCEVFYGGQSFVAKKSAKHVNKERQLLQSLSEYNINPNAGSINHKSKPKSMASEVPYAKSAIHCSKIAEHVEVSAAQKAKDIERLRLLREENVNYDSFSTINLINDKGTVPAATSSNGKQSNAPNKFLNREFSFAKKVPTLSQEDFSIDLSFDRSKANSTLAKMKALNFVKNNPIEKSNPNFIKYRGTSNKKRVIDEVTEINNIKRFKLENGSSAKDNDQKSRIQRIIAATSINASLAEIRNEEATDKYFEKLEKKEQLEEKMLGTYKMKCKAVICHQCKYTAFSAADQCKRNNHKLSVIDSEKRFFKCLDCGNRTVTLFKIPTISCKNCHSSRWQKAPMMREKKLNTTELSIRGDEEKFIGSANTSFNLNLLVPDEE